MPRGHSLAAIALTLALVVGAVAAFAQTQALKAERPPARPLDFDQKLTPGCDCDEAAATLMVGLRDGQRLDAAIVDEDERSVRTLATNELRGGGPVRFVWTGRDDSGEPVPAGDYRLRLALTEPERSITLPKPIAVEPAASGAEADR